VRYDVELGVIRGKTYPNPRRGPAIKEFQNNLSSLM